MVTRNILIEMTFVQKKKSDLHVCVKTVNVINAFPLCIQMVSYFPLLANSSLTILDVFFQYLGTKINL